MVESYYLNSFNNPSLNKFTDNTMRLYVRDFQGVNGKRRLILVAPLISIPDISGQNNWEAAGSSFKDLVGQAWAEAETNIAAIKQGWLDLFSSENKMSNAQRRTASFVMDSPVKSLKRFSGTEINVPNSISVTYYSADAKEFDWFEGGAFDHTAMDDSSGKDTSSRGRWVTSSEDTKPTKKPLKFIARKLLPICLGYMDVKAETQQNGTNTLINTIKIKPPASYAVPAHKWDPNGTNGSFDLHIGRNIKITGLLPTSIEIKPSKILTVDDDYYYMTVNIGLTQGRQYYSNELINWIDVDSKNTAVMTDVGGSYNNAKGL